MTLARQLVRGRDLGTVSGWNNIAVRIARLLGAPVGGLLVAWRGPAAPMLLNAVTFLVVAAALVVVVRPRYVPAPVAPASPGWPASATASRYLRRTPAARMLVLGLTGLNVFVTPVVALGRGAAGQPVRLGLGLGRHRRGRRSPPARSSAACWRSVARRPAPPAPPSRCWCSRGPR